MQDPSQVSRVRGLRGSTFLSLGSVWPGENKEGVDPAPVPRKVQQNPEHTRTHTFGTGSSLVHIIKRAGTRATLTFDLTTPPHSKTFVPDLVPENDHCSKRVLLFVVAVERLLTSC